MGNQDKHSRKIYVNVRIMNEFKKGRAFCSKKQKAL